MMSSEDTSSPVSASTLAYLMRCPVLRLIWLKETFSVSDVAGYRATGQVTSERRRKPFQLARGAMGYSDYATDGTSKNITGEPGLKHPACRNLSTTLIAVRSSARCGVLRRFAAAAGSVPEHRLRSCVGFGDGGSNDRNYRH